MLTRKVPTMDWPSRQTWHSRIPLRSREAGFQKDDSILLLHLQVQGQRPVAIENATALRPVRESHSICHALVLCRSRTTESGNSRRSIQQYSRHFKRWAQAILESEKSYAGREHTGNCTLSRDTGPNIRKSLAKIPLSVFADCLPRSSALLLSSQPFGAGSRNGSTLLPPPKSSSYRTIKSYLPYHHSSRLRTYLRSTAAAWILSAGRCHF